LIQSVDMVYFSQCGIWRQTGISLALGWGFWVFTYQTLNTLMREATLISCLVFKWFWSSCWLAAIYFWCKEI